MPPCTWPTTQFYTTSGGYWKSCGGASGVIAPFAALTLAAAQQRCCADSRCAGLDWLVESAGNSSLGSGFLKTNAVCGWTNSSYIGSYKPGCVPGH